MSDRFKKSKLLFKEYKQYFPGGLNTPERFYDIINDYSLFFKKAKGSNIIDIDGNEYIDYYLARTTAILGHNHSFIIQAIKENLSNGINFTSNTELELEIAKYITSAFNFVDKIRILESTNSAIMSAIKIARAYTGRKKILKFEGCIHGHYDPLVVKSSLSNQVMPDSAGIPKRLVKDTIIAQFNDIEQLEKTFEEFEGEIAAVIIEPIATNMGLIPSDNKFLKRLRDITKENGTILIFDETTTAFRVQWGGAASIYNIDPDLIIISYGINAGLSLAILGGKSEYLDQLIPFGGVYQTYPLSTNNIAAAATLATLKFIDKEDNFYNFMETKVKKLTKGIKELAKKHNIPLKIHEVGSLFSLYFTDKEIKNYLDIINIDTQNYIQIFNFMLEHNILLPPSGFDVLSISYAHTITDIEKTLNVFDKAFQSLNE